MGMFSRIWTGIRGLFDEQVRRFEWKHPEAVLGEELKQNQEALGKLVDALARLEALREEQARVLEADVRDLEDIEAGLRTAVEMGDDVNGPALLMQRDELRRIVADREKALQQIDEDLDQMRGDYNEAVRQVHYLKADKERLIAQIRTLQSLHEIDKIRKLIHVPEEGALSSLRQRVAQERQRQRLERRMGATSQLPRQTAYAVARHEFRKLRGRQDDAGVKEAGQCFLPEDRELSGVGGAGK